MALPAFTKPEALEGDKTALVIISPDYQNEAWDTKPHISKVGNQVLYPKFNCLRKYMAIKLNGIILYVEIVVLSYS